MKKFYFLILGIVLCGMVAQAQNCLLYTSDAADE